ncbi:MAG: DNA/RNA nuclease SfsA, partial [Lachnospiraceae bacterium]|nr:DNA/RNA nuclease SfsA [Lachnospiraceae bacterium]
MKYERIEEAVFKSRPNRFIAQVATAKGSEICHVKNTGRCRELLVPDARI